MKSLKIIIPIVLMLWTSAFAHQPDMSDERAAYVARDGLMHLMHQQRYILTEMLVGKKPIDQDIFVRSAKSIAALASMIPRAFEKNLMVFESRSNPEIWKNWDDFISVAENLRKVADEIASSAETHGAASIIEKVRQIDCGSCHGPYRN